VRSKLGVFDNLLFYEGAVEDLLNLDRPIQKEALKQLVKIDRNPFAGQEPGNRIGMNLTGYRKLYFHQKKYRIVWQVLADGKGLISHIWGVGPRDKAQIYRLVMERVKAQKNIKKFVDDFQKGDCTLLYCKSHLQLAGGLFIF